jgi:hypothetical protein
MFAGQRNFYNAGAEKQIWSDLGGDKLQFMMEQRGKHTASQRRSQFDRFAVGAGLSFSQVIVELNRAAEACGAGVRQDSELMSQTLLAAMRDQPQLVSTEKCLELSSLVEVYTKTSPKDRAEKKVKDIYTDIAERLTAIVGTKVVRKSESATTTGTTGVDDGRRKKTICKF